MNKPTVQEFDQLITSLLEHWINHPWSSAVATCWLFVSFVAGMAVFYHSVRDTVMERIALSAISMGCLGKAILIFGRGETSIEGAWTAFALAFYCLSLWWKHVWVIPRRPDYKPPHKMPRY